MQNRNQKPKAQSGAFATQTEKATFAIDGLTDYVLRLPVANTYVDFNFTGGLLSGYGVRPATFSTDDPIRIRMLEASDQYRSGRIRRLS